MTPSAYQGGRLGLESDENKHDIMHRALSVLMAFLVSTDRISPEARKHARAGDHIITIHRTSLPHFTVMEG